MFKKLFLIALFGLIFIPSSVSAQQVLQNVNGSLQNQSNSPQNTGTINSTPSQVQDNSSDILTKNAGSNISIDKSQTPKSTNEPTNDNKKSDNGWWVIIIIVLCVLGFFAFSYYITADKSPKKPADIVVKPKKEATKPLKNVEPIEVIKPKKSKKKRKTKKAHR
jgi:hypothetical protein